MAKKYNEIEVKDNMKVAEEEVEETLPPRDKKDIKAVLSVKPTKVKHSLFGRLISGMVGPEGLPGIGAYVNDEIIKPAIKNIIVDAVTSGINMVMHGDRGGQSRGSGRQYPGSSRAPYRPSTQYNNNYRGQEPQQQERVIVNAGRGGIEEYNITDRFDAAHVLTTLTELADMYDRVSVADYYDLIGVPSKYTDNNHGWTMDTITRSTIVPVRGGYVIKFPPVEVI